MDPRRGFLGSIRLKTPKSLFCRSEIDKSLKSEKRIKNKTIKFLLLGAGESGKSTILKQMRLLYMNGFTDEELRQAGLTILANLLDAFRNLLGIMTTEHIKFGSESAKLSANLITQNVPESLLHEFQLDTATGAAMKNLWQDSGVQVAVSSSRRLPFHDNLIYFQNAIDRMFVPGWIPGDRDILQARLRTTGISEINFNFGQVNWRMIDIGGQRSERRKWIHCFENVDCLIFVVALSGYDQCLAEDHNVNQIYEAMELYDSLINGVWFRQKSAILFLNKFDICKEIITYSPISAYFPDFHGTRLATAAAYFAGRVQDINRAQVRQIYMHYTNATDTNLLKVTMASIHHDIVRKNLSSLGLLQ